MPTSGPATGAANASTTNAIRTPGEKDFVLSTRTRAAMTKRTATAPTPNTAASHTVGIRGFTSSFMRSPKTCSEISAYRLSIRRR